MIDLYEFERFNMLRDQNAMLYITWMSGNIDHKVVRLPDQLPIVVHIWGDGRKYDYVMSNFGVVRQLDDEGKMLDKSPLCEQLDTAIRTLIEKEKENARRSTARFTKP